MKVVGIALVLAVLVAVAPGDTLMSLSDQQKYALTTIDSVPSSQDLIDVNLTVPDALIAIAANTDNNPDYDTAVRLRAVRGLAVYCTTTGNSCPDGGAVHTALKGLISATGSAHSGSDLLLLRAAIEADGPLKVQNDFQDFLGPLLDHPSRDVRAATARALGQLCNTNAIDALRLRYQNESTDQVKLAISAALRTLPCPVN